MPKPIRQNRRRTPRLPAFVPVPLRTRVDGWTPARQARFLAALALTRNVRTAARRVGLSRTSAYRLRRHAQAQSFAAAWDTILTPEKTRARKVTPAELWQRVNHGLLTPRITREGGVLILWKQDNSALLTLLRRYGRPRALRTCRAVQQNLRIYQPDPARAQGAFPGMSPSGEVWQ